MKALDEAAVVVGSLSALAVAVGASQSAPSMWKKRGNVPAEYCPAIERETAKRGHRVPCESIRPDVDWAVLRKPVKRMKVAA